MCVICVTVQRKEEEKKEEKNDDKRITEEGEMEKNRNDMKFSHCDAGYDGSTH